MDAREMSDMDLLATALEDALDAHRKGVIIGPALDVVTLRRAERRARRNDTARALRTVPVEVA